MSLLLYPTVPKLEPKFPAAPFGGFVGLKGFSDTFFALSLFRSRRWYCSRVWYGSPCTEDIQGRNQHSYRYDWAPLGTMDGQHEGTNRSWMSCRVERRRLAKEAILKLEAPVTDKGGVGLELRAFVSRHGLLDLGLVRIADGHVRSFAKVADALHSGLISPGHPDRLIWYLSGRSIKMAPCVNALAPPQLHPPGPPAGRLNLVLPACSASGSSTECGNGHEGIKKQARLVQIQEQETHVCRLSRTFQSTSTQCRASLYGPTAAVRDHAMILFGNHQFFQKLSPRVLYRPVRTCRHRGARESKTRGGEAV